MIAWRFLVQGARRYPLLVWSSLALIVVGQLFEGIGIGLFLPLIQVFGEGQGTQPAGSALGQWVFWGLDRIGIPVSLGPILVFIMLVFAIKGLLQFLGSVIANVIHVRFCTDVRQELYRATLDARYSFLLSRKVGHFSNLMSNEVFRAAGGIDSSLGYLGELLAIGTYLVCSMLISWQATGTAILVSGLGYVLLWPIVQSGRRHSVERHAAENEIQSLMYESLSSVRSIKGMGREASFIRRVCALIEHVRSVELRRMVSASFLTAISEPAAVLAVCLMLFFGVTLAKLEVGAFLLLVALLYRTIRKLSVIPKQHHSLQVQFPSFAEIAAWFEQASSAAEHSDGRSRRIDRFESLQLDQVTFAYQDLPVLRKLDFRLERGEMVAIVGSSGAGKTTLVGLIMGLLRDYDGRILVNGDLELRELEPQFWRRRMGYVSQEIHLFNGTIGQNIAFFVDVPQERIRQAAEQAYCLEFIEGLPDGFDTLVGDRGVRLSGGQRQRLALARALVNVPEILVLDEATSDLDSESEARIKQSIEELRSQLTIVAIAHRLSTIQEADRICVLADGGRREEGSYQELIEKGGEFARLYRHQLGAGV